MKLLKYTLLLSGLLLAFHAAAQPDTRRMNISIGVFTPSATSYDYEGAIGVVGSTGYTVDDIQPGDMFWDDRSRYQVDSIDIIVAGSSAMVWVTDLYSAGAPQSGKGTLGKPSPNTGVQPLTENGSNFITEAQEAKILTDNLNRLDSLGGDGNGIIDSLPTGNVYVDALGNDFGIYNTSSTYLTGDEVVLGQTWSDYLQVTDDNIFGEVDGGGGSASIDLSSNYIGLRKYKDNTQNNTIGFENDRGIYFTGEESNVSYTYEFPTTSPGANQILTEGATDDNVLEWADMPSGADGNGIYSGEGDIPGYTNAYLDPVEGRLQITNNFSSLSAKFGHDAAANYISLGTFDDTFLKSAILQLSAEKDGSIPPYASLRTINLLTGGTSSIELDELSADISSNGLIHLITDSFRVSNYAETSGYTLPVTSPGPNQILTEGATDDDVLEWADMPSGADGNGIFDGGGTLSQNDTYVAMDAAGWKNFNIGYFDNPLSPVDGTDNYGMFISYDYLGQVGLVNSASSFQLNTGGWYTKGSYTFGGKELRGEHLTLPVFRDVKYYSNVLEASNNNDSQGASVGVATSYDDEHSVAGIRVRDFGSAAGIGLHITNEPVTSNWRGMAYDGNFVPDMPNGGVAIAQKLNDSTYYNWIEIPYNRADTSDQISFYNGAYELPNAVPGSDEIMYWPTPTTPAFKADKWLGSELAAGTVTIDGGAHDLYLNNTYFNVETPSGNIVGFSDSGFNFDFLKFGNYFGFAGGSSELRLYLESSELILNPTVTRINSTDSATGNLIISGNTSLPSSLSHIMGTDTAQVNVRAAGGIDLNSTQDIVVKANGGTSFSGNTYAYDFPTETPTAADTLKRVMVWEEGASTFELHNGSNYRTLTATGNILPNDDYVELDPSVTSHLPAPSTSFKGKRYTIIAGGGVGGGTPVTIDVVDGSSTIETGASLTIGGAFESYTLVCNGSQWAIISDTTTP